MHRRGPQAQEHRNPTQDPGQETLEVPRLAPVGSPRSRSHAWPTAVAAAATRAGAEEEEEQGRTVTWIQVLDDTVLLNQVAVSL